jgi:hypothetical protein
VTKAGKTTLRGAVARTLATALLLAAAALAIGATASKAAARSPAPRPLYTGVTNIGSSQPLAYERTRAAGARFVRIPLDWTNAAPKTPPANWRPDDPSDPNYDWEDGDTNVTHAVQAGLIPVLQIDNAPPWVERCRAPSYLPSAICDPDPGALAAFGAAAARHYSGNVPGVPRVQYWQPLNEPNLSLFFFPQFDTSGNVLSASLYRNLINAFYASVKTVDPSNLVLLGGLGPNAVPTWTIGPLQFARELLCMRGRKRPRPAPGDCGGGVSFDIFAIQPYSTGGPTHLGGVNDVQIGGLARLTTLIKAADKAKRIRGSFPHTPLWVTEFSWDTSPPDPGGLPMAIASRWTAEALHHAWQVGISNFFWYSLHDDAPSSRAFSASLESGLYFRGPTLEVDQPKEVLQAFHFPFVAYPSGRRFYYWGRTPTSGPGKVRIEVWTGRSWRKLALRKAAVNGIFEGYVRSTYGKRKKGMARATYYGAASLPFSMKPVPDFKHEPFG